MIRISRAARSSLHVLVAIGVSVMATACGSSSDETPAGGDGTDGGAGTADGGTGGGDAGTTQADASIDGVVAVKLAACTPLVYAADVAIGAQSFQLIVDTGSTSLGVAGTGCTNCSVTPLYNPGTTGVDRNKTASAQFGSGKWSGKVYGDTVGFAPKPTTALDFVSITSQTGFFQAGSTCGGKAYQGLLGFGRTAAAVSGTKGLFDQLVSAESFADVFATQLCDDGGTLWIGGYDPAATTAAPVYTPFTTDVAASYYYTVALATVDVAGTSVPVPAGTFNDTVLDTGSSAFLLGDTAYKAVTAAIAKSPGFAQVCGASAATSWFGSTNGGVSCANLTQTKAQLDATLPPLTLSFAGGVQVQAPATESYLMPYTGAGWCNALVSVTPGQNFPLAAIMGAPVLRSSVVITDRANARVGFAPHKPCAGAAFKAGAVASATNGANVTITHGAFKHRLPAFLSR
jgi:hypothetical protein